MKIVIVPWLGVVVTIGCWHTMALVVFFQKDEDILSVYRNLKIFCEMAPCTPHSKLNVSEWGILSVECES